MLTMGLDIATHTGVYLLQDTHSVIEDVSFGTKVEFPTMRGLQRAVAIATRVEALIEAHKPDLIVVEEYAHSRNIKSFIKVVEVGTLIRYHLYRRPGIPWVTVTPKTLKLWFTGHGGAKKTKMKEVAAQKYGIMATSDDIVDAYALARMGQMGVDEILQIPGVTLGA